MKSTATIVLTTTILATAWMVPQLRANELTGSIGFGSYGATVSGGTDLATASSFLVTDPFITSETGVYTSAPLTTAVTFNGFQFNPPVASVSPLWSFSVGSVNYTFDATSVSCYFDAALNQWDIGGSGIAMVTGYSATPGTWNVNLSQSGATIVFDSSAAATPTAMDGGSTLLMLGSGFMGLAAVGRKFKV